MTIIKIIFMFVFTIILGAFIYDYSYTPQEEEQTAMSHLVNQVGLAGRVEPPDVKKLVTKTKEKIVIGEDKKLKNELKSKTVDIKGQWNEIKALLPELYTIRSTKDQKERLQQYEVFKIQLFILMGQVVENPEEDPELTDIFNRLEILMEGQEEELAEVCADPAQCLKEELDQIVSQLSNQLQKGLMN